MINLQYTEAEQAGIGVDLAAEAAGKRAAQMAEDAVREFQAGQRMLGRAILGAAAFWLAVIYWFMGGGLS